ncbi:anaerobic ribonucleoside-triphosphate reductase activating protein [archaeon]|nr:MAG: anaerobic ribonucleoside-triphosphate reductase activating protein [archaeon]
MPGTRQSRRSLWTDTGLNSMSKLKVSGFIELSTLDYPGHVSSLIYLTGCNFRCPFCQNPEIVLEKSYAWMTVNDILNKLSSAIDFIDAIVITGGEPLLQDITAIKQLIKAFKDRNLKILIETNGSFPDKLEQVLPLIDEAAIDLKGPKHKYPTITGIKRNFYDHVLQSIQKCRKHGVPVEARITIVPGLNDAEEDILAIKEDINLADKISIQQFRNIKTLDPTYMEKPIPTKDQLIKIAKLLKKNKPITIKTMEEIIKL